MTERLPHKVGVRPQGNYALRERADYFDEWKEENRGNVAPSPGFVAPSGAWNTEKVEAFRAAFFEFLGYLRINSKEKGGDYRLVEGLYEAQYRFLDTIFDGLAEDIHDFKCLKSRQLGMCLDPATRILTVDLRWVPISEIAVGEKIVAVDEFPRGGMGGDRHMSTGVIEAKNEVVENAYRISFQDGRSVICTGKHRWLARTADVATRWATIEDIGRDPNRPLLRTQLQLGDKIRWITKPWDEPDFEDGWFGGMLDGEGSHSNGNRSGAAVMVCQKHGPVWDRLNKYARDRGYNYTTENDLNPRLTKFGTEPCPKICFTRMDEIFRLIGQTRGTRFLGWEFWQGRSLPGKHSGIGWSVIIGIEPLGPRRMIDLQTSTGTFIAEGFVSHNSTISRALVIFWLGMHRGMQGAMIFDTESHKEEAREEIEGMIQSLDPELGFPRILKLNRYNLSLSNNSRLRFMAAGTRTTKSSGVLGRSSGINLVHASEICSWENEEGVVALTNALSRNYPDRLYIWESTARGFNAWHDMWQQAQKDDLNQRTLFTTWYHKDDQRIPRGTPRFERYGKDPPTEKERERIEEVRELYGFEIVAEQLAWYRELTDPTREREDNEPEDSYQLQDQPWVEDDAFQQTGSTFFEGSKLRERMVAATQKKFSSYKFHPGSDFVTTQIYPATTWRDIDIKVWEEPVHDAVYVISADPAFGHDPKSNYSAVEVGRCYADQIEQVAEFTSTSTLTHQLAYLLWALVGWYGSMPGSQVLVIIEINGPGESVWREYNLTRAIVQNGYLRPAAREKGLTDIFQNARNYVYQRSDSLHPGHNLHWKTTHQLKVAIMERLRDFTHNGGIILNSVDSLEEMKAITRDGDNIGGEGSSRDDRTMALAMMVRGWEEKLRRALIAQNRTKEADVARRRMNMIDQMQLHNRYRISEFFARKSEIRRQDLYAQQRRALHVRARLPGLVRR